MYADVNIFIELPLFFFIPLLLSCTFSLLSFSFACFLLSACSPSPLPPPIFCGLFPPQLFFPLALLLLLQLFFLLCMLSSLLPGSISPFLTPVSIFPSACSPSLPASILPLCHSQCPHSFIVFIHFCFICHVTILID